MSIIGQDDIYMIGFAGAKSLAAFADDFDAVPFDIPNTGTLLYSEDFQTSIDSDWAVQDVGAMVVANSGQFLEDALKDPASNQDAIYLKTAQLNQTDFYAEVQCHNINSSRLGSFLGVRVNPTNGDGLWLTHTFISSAGRFGLYKRSAGVLTLLTSFPYNAGVEVIEKLIFIVSRGHWLHGFHFKNDGSLHHAMSYEDTTAAFAGPGSIGLAKFIFVGRDNFMDKVECRALVEDNGTWVRMAQAWLSEDDTPNANVYGRNALTIRKQSGGWVCTNAVTFNVTDQENIVEYYMRQVGAHTLACAARWDGVDQGSGYICMFEFSVTYRIHLYRVDNGVLVSLATQAGIAAPVADTIYKLKIRAEGTTITGTLLDAIDTVIATVNTADATYSSGRAGIWRKHNQAQELVIGNFSANQI